MHNSGGVRSEKNKIKAFIFDMDGTLLETTHIDYKAWVKLFGDHNTRFMSFDEYRKLLGVKSSEVIKKYLGLEDELLDEALEKRLRYIKEILEKEGLRTVADAEQFLKATSKAGFRMALATGARREKMETVMGKTDLHKYFEVIVTANDVAKGKPDPDLFLQAAKLLNVSPSEAVVIEDAENGVIAAKNAGMKCIAITTTTPAQFLEGADLIIKSYSGLDPVLLADQLDPKPLQQEAHRVTNRGNQQE